MSTPATHANAPVRGHPKGLYLLFATEMWERMSYYGMRALLVLYMVSQQKAALGEDPFNGGMAWKKSVALQIYGLYTGLVYLTPVAGGWLADRYLGQRRAVTLGGVLMMIGHFLMAVPGVPAFYAALTFLILGNGFFKPNISTMVGGLYEKDDPRRDGAFTIFYMGINLGALLSPLVCGTLGERYGWHWGFGSAGVGMLLGLLTYLFFQKRLLGEVGKHPAKKPVPSEGKFDQSTEHYREAALPELPPLTRIEKDRIIVIVVLSFFVMFFWAAFEQAGGLMNLYTDEKVDRHLFGWEVPTTWFQSINPFFILLLGPPFAMMWTALGKRDRDPSTPMKMGLGMILLSLGFVFMLGASRQSAAQGKAALAWVVMAYLFHTMGELCLSPVGLSMVTRMAPARFASLLMGFWFLSSAAANYLAGWIGTFSERLGEFKLFGVIATVTMITGLVMLALARPILRMMHEHEKGETSDQNSEPDPAEQRQQTG